MQTFKSSLIFGHVQGMWQTMPQKMIPDHRQFPTLGQESNRITEAWTEGVPIMLAHVTETVCGVSCSTSAELLMCCWHAADMLLTCCCHRVQSISWLYRSASELPDTVYVASTRMQTTVTYTITKNQTCTCTWSNFPRGECMNLTAQVWHTQLQHLEADAKWMQLEQFLSQ